MNSRRRDSCHELFRQLNILPLQSQYIFSLFLFIIKNRVQFLSNLEVQDINTRYNSNLRLHLVNLTLNLNSIFYAAITCHLLSRTYKMMGNVFKQL